MIFYIIGHEFGMYFEPSEEVSNPDDERFYSLLEEKCVHSQLSLAVRMLSNKSEASRNQNSFDQWVSLMIEISPQPETIPKDFY